MDTKNLQKGSSAKTKKLLKNILAASSLAAITLGASNALAAQTLTAAGAGGAFTIDNAGARGIPAGATFTRSGVDGDFQAGDNVTFGIAGVNITNAFAGNVGSIDFQNFGGTFTQNVVGQTIGNIAQTGWGGGNPTGTLEIAEDTELTAANAANATLKFTGANKTLTIGGNTRLGTIDLNDKAATLTFSAPAEVTADLVTNATGGAAKGTIDAGAQDITWVGNIGSVDNSGAGGANGNLAELKIGTGAAAKTFEYKGGIGGVAGTVYIQDIKFEHANSLLKFNTQNATVVATADTGAAGVNRGKIEVEDAHEVTWTGNIGAAAANNSLAELKLTAAASKFNYADGEAYVASLNFANADAVLKFSGAASKFVAAGVAGAAGRGIVETSGVLTNDLLISLDGAAGTPLKAIKLNHTGGTVTFDKNIKVNGDDAIKFSANGTTVFKGINVEFGANGKGFAFDAGAADAVLVFDLDGGDRTVTVTNNAASVSPIYTDNGRGSLVVKGGNKLSFIGNNLARLADDAGAIKSLKKITIEDATTLDVGKMNVNTMELDFADNAATFKATSNGGAQAINAGLITVVNNGNGVLDYTANVGGNLTHQGNIGTNAAKLGKIKTAGVANVVFNGAAGAAGTFFVNNVDANAAQTHFNGNLTAGEIKFIADNKEVHFVNAGGNHSVDTVNFDNKDGIIKFTQNSTFTTANGLVIGAVANKGSVEVAAGRTVTWTGNIGAAGGNNLATLNLAGAASKFNYAGGDAFVNNLTFSAADAELIFSGQGKFAANQLTADVGVIKTEGNLGPVLIPVGAKVSTPNLTVSIDMTAGGGHKVGSIKLGHTDGYVLFDKLTDVAAGSIELNGSGLTVFAANVNFVAANQNFVINNVDAEFGFDLTDRDVTVTLEGATKSLITSTANNQGHLAFFNDSAVADRKFELKSGGAAVVLDSLALLARAGGDATIKSLSISSLRGKGLEVDLGTMKSLKAGEINFEGAGAKLTVASIANENLVISGKVQVATNGDGNLKYTATTAGKTVTHTDAIGAANARLNTVETLGAGAVEFQGAVNAKVLTLGAQAGNVFGGAVNARDITANENATFKGAVNVDVDFAVANDKTVTFASAKHNVGTLTLGNLNSTVTFAGGTIDGTIDGNAANAGVLNAHGTYNGAIGSTNAIQQLNVVGESSFKDVVKAVNTKIHNLNAAGKANPTTVTFGADADLGAIDFNNVTANVGRNSVVINGGDLEGTNNFVLTVASKDNKKTGNVKNNGAALTKANGSVLKLNIGTVEAGEYYVGEMFKGAKLIANSNLGTIGEVDDNGKILVKITAQDIDKKTSDIERTYKDQGGNPEALSQFSSWLKEVNANPNGDFAKAWNKSTTAAELTALYANPDTVTDYKTASDEAQVPVATVTQATANQAASNITSHLATLVQPAAPSVAIAAGDAGEDGKNLAVWGGAYTNQGDQKADGSIAAYKSNNAGGTVGADFVGDVNGHKFVLGGAFTFDSGDIKYKKGFKNGDKTKLNTNVFSLYTNVDLYKGIFARGIVSYGTSDVKSDTKRAGLVAKADYTTKFVITQVEGGYNHSLDNMNAFATVGGRFSNIRTPEYTESGSNFNHTVRKSTTNRFDVVGSVGVNSTIMSGDVAFVPNAKFSVAKKVGGKTPDVKYTIGDLPEDTKVAVKQDSTYAEASAGLNVKYNGLDFGVKANYGFANKFSNVGGALVVRAEF